VGMKNEIKIRHAWSLNPINRIHSLPKGKKQYRRSDTRKAEKNWSD